VPACSPSKSCERLTTRRGRLSRHRRGDNQGVSGPQILLGGDERAQLVPVDQPARRYGVSAPRKDAQDASTCSPRHAAVDLILMDVMMPENRRPGSDRRIRTRPEHASLPIVALTAKALPGDRERAWSGCSDFATKPVAPETLAGCSRSGQAVKMATRLKRIVQRPVGRDSPRTSSRSRRPKRRRGLVKAAPAGRLLYCAGNVRGDPDGCANAPAGRPANRRS